MLRRRDPDPCRYRAVNIGDGRTAMSMPRTRRAANSSEVLPQPPILRLSRHRCSPHTLPVIVNREPLLPSVPNSIFAQSHSREPDST